MVSVGETVGLDDGLIVLDGGAEGTKVMEGSDDGTLEGERDGCRVNDGKSDGLFEGPLEGESDFDGPGEGCWEGMIESVGKSVGDLELDGALDLEGMLEGEGVGTTVSVGLADGAILLVGTWVLPTEGTVEGDGDG